MIIFDFSNQKLSFSTIINWFQADWFISNEIKSVTVSLWFGFHFSGWLHLNDSGDNSKEESSDPDAMYVDLLSLTKPTTGVAHLEWLTVNRIPKTWQSKIWRKQICQCNAVVQQIVVLRSKRFLSDGFGSSKLFVMLLPNENLQEVSRRHRVCQKEKSRSSDRKFEKNTRKSASSRLQQKNITVMWFNRNWVSIPMKNFHALQTWWTFKTMPNLDAISWQLPTSDIEIGRTIMVDKSSLANLFFIFCKCAKAIFNKKAFV